MKRTADEHSKSVSSLRPEQRTASANGAAVDCREFGEAKTVLDIGAFANGTLVVTIEDSADGTTGFALVPGATMSSKTTTEANKEFVGRINVESTKRFIRAVATMASTPDATFSVMIELSAAKRKPVVQTQTVEFSLDS